MTELWIPSRDREPHFSVPSIEDLTAEWIGGRNSLVLNLPDTIYGVAEAPRQKPRAILSIDLCEVVRQTGVALLEMAGGTIDDMVADGTTGYMDYGSTINGWPADVAQSNRQLYIQEFMHHGQVQPVPHRSGIMSFMQKWRQDGAYILANTSTLPGCEISTIRFLEEQYAGCFDGLLFPRNHDGNGTTTKATALQAVIDIIDEPQQTPVIAIDDALHHAHDLDGIGAEVYVPAYAWNKALDGHPSITRVTQRFGTVDCFIAVDNRLMSPQIQKTVA